MLLGLRVSGESVDWRVTGEQGMLRGLQVSGESIVEELVGFESV